MTYDEALQAIAALQVRGWRLGLDRMEAYVSRLGLEEAVRGHRPKFVHIAGTNGKGSTTAFTQALLQASGLTNGAYFSPFVLDPRERIQANGQLISRSRFANLVEKLLEVGNGLEATIFGGVTEFELKTALGLQYWQEKQVEWVALETGLGGRLDATNVVTPAVSVIVSIGMDHQAILGPTLEAIAFEKAGIIKPSCPVIIGAMPDGPRRVIEETARKHGSQIWRFGYEIFWEGDTIVTPAGTIGAPQPAMKGAWQPHNFALALAALQMAGLTVSSAAVKQAAGAAEVPGRFQELSVHGNLVILDGAHNADSALALVRTLIRELPRDHKLILVTNMVMGHEPEKFYAPLLGVCHEAWVVPINFHRARPAANTAECLSNLGFQTTTFYSIHDALAASKARKATYLVTGSFYLVGEVLAHEQLSERAL